MGAMMTKTPMITSSHVDQEVVVIGAGFAGLGAGIKLKEAGIDRFVILERAGDLGGTWRDNTYPGVAVDISTFSYSYSFEQNPHWSRAFAPGAEVQAYAQHCADKYGLRPHLRFGTSVERAVYDEDNHTWTVFTDSGPIVARFIISATGALTTPKLPDIPGIDDFLGERVHTARWDHDLDLTGKRVGIIGTGATSVQLVPEIADKVSQIHVFQRTPIWVLPKPDAPIPTWVQSMFAHVPLTQRAARMLANIATEIVMVFGIVYNKQLPWLMRRIQQNATRYLHQQVKEPELREALKPDYGFGCKRPSFSNTFYPALTRDDVELVTEPIDRITERGIRTTDGSEREIDVLICATGFKVFEKGNVPSYGVIGRGGVDLSDFWEENRYQAYEGATVPGYPNYFLVPGPYAVGGASWFSMIEAQVAHAMRCIGEARRRNATHVEVAQKPHDAHFAEILRRQQNTVFFNNACGTSNSYYFNEHGDAPFLRPNSGAEMWWRARHFPLRHYRFESLPSAQPQSALGAAPAADAPGVELQTV